MKEIFRYTATFIVIIFVVTLVNSTIQSKINPTDEYCLNVVKVDTSWIYEISIKDKVFIRQEFIPVVKGKQVFQSKQDAETIGEIVLKKLIKKQIPTVTISDLKSNRIIFNDI